MHYINNKRCGCFCSEFFQFLENKHSKDRNSVGKLRCHKAPSLTKISAIASRNLIIKYNDCTKFFSDFLKNLPWDIYNILLSDHIFVNQSSNIIYHARFWPSLMKYFHHHKKYYYIKFLKEINEQKLLKCSHFKPVLESFNQESVSVSELDEVILTVNVKSTVVSYTSKRRATTSVNQKLPTK